MKTFRKAISVLCLFALLTGMLSTAVYAATSDTDYVISNPYETVNWLTWKQFKADLHSHTTASDGTDTLKDMIEAHYAYDFDVLAVTDHGVDSYSWTKQEVIPALKVFVALKDRDGKIETLDKNGGTAVNGNTYALTTKNGGDYYTQTDSAGKKGHEMMRVPFGIENNPSSLNNAHVNSFFVDYGNGLLGGTSDYVTPISNVDKLGGISVINHPGEYTNARDEATTAEAYDKNDTMYNYYINKFASLLKDYPTCIGIDVNSKGDTRTRYDRKLWDILLCDVVPSGRNVFGLATSDAHSVGAVYSGYTEMVMPANTVENLHACLQNGAFFAASKYLGNPEEITEIANEMIASGNKTGSALGEQLLSMQKENPTAKYEAPKDVEAPTVRAVQVDEKEDRITVLATDALSVRWIADGKTIATGSTIDLDNYSDEIGSYVRCEIFGKGGIVYTQPFTLQYDAQPQKKDNVFVDGWLLASIIPDTLVRVLAELTIFETIWNWMQK